VEQYLRTCLEQSSEDRLNEMRHLRVIFVLQLKEQYIHNRREILQQKGLEEDVALMEQEVRCFQILIGKRINEDEWTEILESAFSPFFIEEVIFQMRNYLAQNLEMRKEEIARE
jgi:hypothetical protein